MVLATPPRCPEKEMHRILFAIACTLSATSVLAGDKPYKQEDCGRLTVQMELNECAGANYAAADKALNTLFRAHGVAEEFECEDAFCAHRNATGWRGRDKSCADEVGPQEEAARYGRWR